MLSCSVSDDVDRLRIVERFTLPFVSLRSRVRPGFVSAADVFLVDRVFGGVQGGE